MNLANTNTKVKSQHKTETGLVDDATPARTTFVLYDNFALSHYDLVHFPVPMVKKRTDAKMVGHTLHRAWKQSRSSGPLREHGRELLAFAERTLTAKHQELIAQVAELKALCDADPLIGELPTVSGKSVEVMWDDRRFWILVRMTIVLDEGNRRLLHLYQRGAIDKDEMKRRQRELARPYRSSLLQILEFAGREKELKSAE